VARIDNEVSPRLVSFNQLDRTGHWGAMKRRWAHVEPAPHEFPNKMAPLALVHCADIQLMDHGAMCVAGGTRQFRFTPENGPPQDLNLPIRPMAEFAVTYTAPWLIARRYMGIDEGVCFITHVLPTGTNQPVFPHGGFLYFDTNHNFIAATRIAGQCSTCRFQHFIEFNLPVHPSAADLEKILAESKRWSMTTIPELITGRAKRQTWVAPGEMPKSSGFGALLFELEVGGYVLFPVRVPSY